MGCIVASIECRALACIWKPVVLTCARVDINASQFPRFTPWYVTVNVYLCKKQNHGRDGIIEYGM
jgi:hypothetical protein